MAESIYNKYIQSYGRIYNWQLSNNIIGIYGNMKKHTDKKSPYFNLCIKRAAHLLFSV